MEHLADSSLTFQGSSGFPPDVGTWLLDCFSIQLPSPSAMLTDETAFPDGGLGVGSG